MLYIMRITLKLIVIVMAHDYSQVNFRIPTKLKEKIEEASIINNRSITSELVSRLEDSFQIDGKQPIYLPESNARDLNALITLSLGSIINNLLLNGVPIEIVRKSFPSDDIFQELVDVFIDTKTSDDKKAP